MQINSLVKKHPMFHIVEAAPLESVGIDVLDSDLVADHAEVSKLLQTIDPCLFHQILCNGFIIIKGDEMNALMYTSSHYFFY
jgi:hypothetical protein